MKLQRNAFAWLACAALVCASLSGVAFVRARAQSLGIDRESDARPRELISEGLGVGRIYVGRSTADDVANIYGKTFETADHGARESEMRYSTLGLSFYYCRADQQKRVFRIEARAPFDGFTARGIVVGKSSARDVLAAYGNVEPSASGTGDGSALRYTGVEFALDNKGSGKGVAPGAKVTTISVVTSRAGSDCDAPAAR
jgi:hypothetical protein